MALTAISPFPTDTAPTKLRAAIDILRGALMLGDTTAADGEYDGLDRLLQRMGTAASERVERFAPSAPSATRSEAAIRAVAYLHETRGAQRLLQPDRPANARKLNPVRAEDFATSDWQPAPEQSSGWFRRSGSMSMLAPWRVRGAGICEAPPDDPVERIGEGVVPALAKRAGETRIFVVNVARALRPGAGVGTFVAVDARPDGLTVSVHTIPVVGGKRLQFKAAGGTAGTVYRAQLQYSSNDGETLLALVDVAVTA